MSCLDNDVVLWRTDSEDRLAYLSRNAAVILGVDPLTACGHLPEELWRQRSRFAWPLSRRQAFNGKRLRIRRADGSRVELINSGRPSVVDGCFRGFVGTLNVDRASGWSQSHRAARDFDDFVHRLSSILEFAQSTRSGITCVLLSAEVERDVFDDLASEALLTCTNSHCCWVVLPARSGPPRRYAFCDRLSGTRFAIVGEAPVRHADAVYWLCRVWQELAEATTAAPSPQTAPPPDLEALLRRS